jgi:hypothetical protein
MNGQLPRRDLLKLIALVPASGMAVANGACRSPEPQTTAPPGRLFYVSSAGDDAASGLAENSAWKTITHVNAQLASGLIGVDDSVLFECGRTFYGKIRPPARSVKKGSNYLTIGSYPSGGTRHRPTISSYKLLNRAAGWTQVDDTTWTIDLSPTMHDKSHSGYDGAQGGGGNIGFLKIDEVIRGRRMWRLTDMVEQWDFHCVGNLLSVKSAGNPTALAGDIRAACDGDCISMGNSLRITGLRLEGGGGHGIRGSASNVRVDDNEFAELGGSALDATTRYGNGFEAWIDSTDILVERNIFHDIYDAALTAQGGPTSTTGQWSNIAFRNNLVYFCNQSFEFWSDGEPRRDPGFINCVVECNTCLYAGYGWSSGVRPDQDTKVHLLTYGWVLPADITVRRNVFLDGHTAYRFSASPTPGLHCAENVIYQRRDRPFQLLSGAAIISREPKSTYFAMPEEIKVDVGSALDEVARTRNSCDVPAPP